MAATGRLSAQPSHENGKLKQNQPVASLRLRAREHGAERLKNRMKIKLLPDYPYLYETHWRRKDGEIMDLV